MNKALLSSKKMDYCTPQAFYDRLNEEFHFALDAAATDSTTKCPVYYTPETDGLRSPWRLAGGCCILQPAIRSRDWKVGPQGIRGSAGRGDRCSAYPGQDGHFLLPRLHLRQGRNSFFAWAAAV